MSSSITVRFSVCVCVCVCISDSCPTLHPAHLQGELDMSTAAAQSAAQAALDSALMQINATQDEVLVLVANVTDSIPVVSEQAWFHVVPLIRGHLSNEDSICCPNHIELCTNPPLN